MLDNKTKDWLPGVAGTQPRLEFRFWGVSSEEGGLHQPPFSFSQWFSAVSCFPRVKSRFQGAGPRSCAFFVFGGAWRRVSTRAERRRWLARARIFTEHGKDNQKSERPTGGRPLGRGEWEGTWPEVSSPLHPAQGGEQAVPLRSQAAEQRTGAGTR